MSENIKFGTDGWRDIIADKFTFKNVSIVTKAIGNYVLNHLDKDLPILVGYDNRFLADKFAERSTNELIKLGLKVHLSSSAIPTPVIAFWASKIKTSGAIQFTASHNPPIYCGIKYITNYGGPAPVEVTNEITKYVKNYDSHSEHENTTNDIRPKAFNPKADYLTHLKTLIDFNKIKTANLKIVYDPMYGAGNDYLDFILKESGCQVISIHNTKDPLFGGLLPEPKEEFLNDLKKSIIENKFVTAGQKLSLGC